MLPYHMQYVKLFSAVKTENFDILTFLLKTLIEGTG